MKIEYLQIYLVAINLITFIVYGADKHAAIKGRTRTRVATLLGLAFIGGSLGAFFGMGVFRHKTKKLQFIIGVPFMLIIHVLLIWYFVLPNYNF